MVSDREFRDDLYFRLKVFPIAIPPLRDRWEALPLLVEFFVQEFSRRMNKQIDTIPPSTIARLVEHPWPGNIRELQHFIERAVILTTGSALNAPLDDLKSPVGIESAPATLKQAELVHTLKALRETRWVGGGPSCTAVHPAPNRTPLIAPLQHM